MGEESPASAPTGAVFLSYASQDAEAAQKICEALRAAGIEVWFDQSQLRGGDVWDRQIRRQIHDCILFVPIISAHSDARKEGYFRREWKLAVERTADMAEDVPFLLPIVIDTTPDATARVPDRFREVQWSRLPDGQPSPAFVERVLRLLSPEPSRAPATPRVAVGPVPSANTATEEPVPFWRLKPALLALSAVLALALAYLIVDKVWLSKHATPATVTTASAQFQPPAVPEKSIAVLPFADLSEKRDQEYFADGMAEEILGLLAKIPGLTVIGRTSSFQFKSHAEDLRTIGEKLGVSYVVEGSVRRAGARVRVTAQLIDAQSGAHVWSDNYDRDFGDVLALQDQIATSIARALQLAVTASEKRSMLRLQNREA